MQTLIEDLLDLGRLQGGQVILKIVVYVHDQGIGIPSAGRDRLFDRFYRAGNTGARPFAGLSVGLWIRGQILTLH